MDALFNLIESPRIIPSLVKASKISALRLDHHPQTGALIATVAAGGKIHQREVPLGVTLTQPDIIGLLQGPSPTAISTAPPPDAT
jgi:hypothetical protein